MEHLPDPDWYLDNVLVHATPAGPVPQALGPAQRWQRWWQRLADDPTRPLASAAAQGFVLTSAQLAGLGVTRSCARNHVRQGRWTAVGYGVTAPLDIRDLRLDGATHEARRNEGRRRHALTAAGAVLRRPTAVITGRSAAVLHGLPVMWVPSVAEVTARGSVRLGRRSAAHLSARPSRMPQRWAGTAPP